MNQDITFLSDGGDTVRDLQLYLRPPAEHLLDWFHITMRVTVMKQMAKGMGIPVLELRFEEAEVSWMKPDGEFVGDKRDETVFKQRVEKFLCDNEL